MIEWILHRPPHASNPAEIRVAERLRGLADSPHAWTVIWGYYYQDPRGMQREGDFLPAESGGWWQIYQLLLRQFRESPAGLFYDAAQRPPFRAADRFDPAVLTAAWSQPAHFSWFMAVSRARQTLAVVENG